MEKNGDVNTVAMGLAFIKTVIKYAMLDRIESNPAEN
jgi:hypothetical protein